MTVDPLKLYPPGEVIPMDGDIVLVEAESCDFGLKHHYLRFIRKDSNLPAREVQQIQAHLEACQECREGSYAFWLQYVQTVASGGSFQQYLQVDPDECGGLCT